MLKEQSDISVEVERQEEVSVDVELNEIQIVEVPVDTEISMVVVEIQGPQGPSAVDRPLDYDPLEIYLNARGEFNGNNS